MSSKPYTDKEIKSFCQQPSDSKNVNDKCYHIKSHANNINK